MDDYISREETVKAFCEKCRGYYDGHCVHRGECDVDVIQNVPSANVQPVKQNDWISVKERLPEKDVGVLVYTRNRFVSTLDHEDIDYLEENGEFHRYNGNQYISHWMPLPQKPESESNAE